MIRERNVSKLNQIETETEIEIEIESNKETTNCE
jgi:hypothetical protein